MRLLLLARDIGISSGIPIIHETHRGRFSFAAHVTKADLEELPWLELTLDISHWVTVAENYLTDQSEALKLALLNTRHIHSRVGFTQGPRIINPQRPEWHDAVQFHLNCWDRVVAYRKEDATRQLTFTSEFGPFPYMRRQNSLKEATNTQWESNDYMKDLLKRRYNVVPVIH